MKGNSHVEFLSIAATRSNDPVARVSTAMTFGEREINIQKSLFVYALPFVGVFVCSQACAEMLEENTFLQSLNIESNFITSEGMMAIIKAMGSNATLMELKIDNQVREEKSYTFIYQRLFKQIKNTAKWWEKSTQTSEVWLIKIKEF